MIRFATCNMFKKLTAEKSAEVVAEVIALADVVVWQEVTAVHKHTLRDLVGWETYFSEGLHGIAISWRTAVFTVERGGRTRAVVQGDGRGDPARGFLDIVLRERKSGISWPIIGCHMTHQAFTSHPERWARWHIQAYRLRLRSRRLARQHGRVLGGGDVNRNRWAPKGTEGHWPLEGTHGSAHYDVIWTRGHADLTHRPEAVHTPSDHDASVAPVRVV